MVLRVYRVDCYSHFFVFGFSQDLQFRRGVSAPRLNRNKIYILLIFNYTITETL